VALHESRPTSDPSIIVEPRRDAVSLVLAGLALAAGTAMALQVARAGLTLSHYDAKAHLVVARRILDSLTPGWLQIGAVWLPLPHLLQMLPTQVDVFYRTGAFAVAFNVTAFAAGVWLIARLIREISGSRLAAAAGASVMLINPNVLYLQSTPMTEPLLVLLLLGSVWLVRQALVTGGDVWRRRAGWALAAACLTRYEAWPVTAAILAVSAPAGLALGRSWREAVAATLRLAVYPAAAGLAFLLLSRATVGEWFVQSGFFVPENEAMHRPLAAAVSVWWGVHEVSSYPLLVLGAAGLLLLVWTVGREPRRLADLLPLALLGTGALPWYAFFQGHPFRIRYMVVLIPAVAIGLGLLVGLTARRVRLLAAAAAVVALVTAPWPWNWQAPMLLEAQWDHDHRVGRAQVTAYLRGHWNGQPIMASMGSLAHYMQELSDAGFALRDFLHEGNGDIWLASLEAPQLHVEWMLIEEQAEGGDMLAALARQRPAFLSAYDRVAEGGGVALYRRRPPAIARTGR